MTFRSLRTLALFAYLTVESDRPHSREYLGGLFWPDSTAQAARQSVRQSLFQFGKLFPQQPDDKNPYLITTRSSVQFNARANYWLDTAHFTSLLDACDSHTHKEIGACGACMQRIREAVDLYRGDFLQGFYIDQAGEFEDWQLMQREWLRQRVLDSLYILTDHELRHAAHGDARRAARRQLEIDPLREEAHRQLMLSLARDGRRAEALVQYERCRTILQDELGVPPARETEVLAEHIRAGTLDDPPARAVTVSVSDTAGTPERIDNVPAALTPVLAREEELNRLSTMLLDPAYRLVTLCGPGGVGKTTLILEAARAMKPHFAGGVCWVPLVAVPGAEDETEAVAERIAIAVGSALNLSFAADDPAGTVCSYLQNRELLLVLDNYEQLLPETTLIRRMLEAAPRLTILISSRERLDLRMERALDVPGLPIPDPAAVPAQQRAAAGVRLFVERAAASPFGFELTDEELPHVVEICRLTEGVPLALELAASWVDQFTCAEIARHIQVDRDFLAADWDDTPDRHRSMRAVFDHSWRLLNDSQRTTLALLAVFRGNFTRAAALAVTGCSLSDLAALNRKSLLRRSSAGLFNLHELTRQFAEERLLELEGARQIELRRHYATYYLRMLNAREAELFGADPRPVLAHVRSELQNIRQAWYWAATYGLESDLRAALPALSRYYDVAGLASTGLGDFAIADALLTRESDEDAATPNPNLLGALRTEQGHMLMGLSRYDEARRTLSEAESLITEPRLQAALYLAWGRSLYRLGRYQEARRRIESAVVLAEKHDAAWLLADALLALGDIIVIGLEIPEESHYARALGLYRTAGDRRGEASALNCLGLNYGRRQEYAAGRDYIEQALEIHRAIGDRRNECVDLNNLGLFAAEAEDFAESDAYLHEAVAIARAIGYRSGILFGAVNLGANAMDQDRLAEAEAHFTQSLVLNRDTGSTHSESTIYLSLGDIALRKRDTATALTAYEKALRVLGESENHALLYVRHRRIAQAHDYAGAFVDARAALATAMEHAEALDDPARIGAVAVEQGRIELALANLPAAAAALARAQTHADAGVLPAGGSGAMATLARLDLERADPAAALSWAKQAIAAAVQDPDPNAELDGLLALLEAEHALGDEEAAVRETADRAYRILQAADHAPSRVGSIHTRTRREPLKLTLAILTAGTAAHAFGRPDAREILHMVDGARLGGVARPFFLYRQLHRCLAADHPAAAARIADLALEHLHMLLAELDPIESDRFSHNPDVASFLDAIHEQVRMD